MGFALHEKHLAMRRSEARPSGPARVDNPLFTEDKELQDKVQESGKHRFMLYNTLPFKNLGLVYILYIVTVQTFIMLKLIYIVNKFLSFLTFYSSNIK